LRSHAKESILELRRTGFCAAPEEEVETRMVNGILLGATITLLCGCAATAAGDDADAGSIATRSTVCD
jgi:hypothetical protein